MKEILQTTLVLLITVFSVNAQQSMLPVSDVELVKSVIIELFDGYKAGDSLRVKNTFTSDAMLQTAYFDKSGQSQLSKSSPVSKFITYVGAGFDKEHDEQLWDIEIKIDNNLATVWCKYAFYLGENFSHCGAENFLLVKKNKEWKIFHLVDTRQQTDCKIPDSIKNR